jgi:hypothetical protein
MKQLVAMIVMTAMTSAMAATAPPLPIHSGQYVFQLRHAEQPNMPGIKLIARIHGHHIILINKSKSDIFPKGVIADGQLMWNADAGHWIIGYSDSDRYTKEVGGCSGGPEVVDLRKRIYWAC